jgi:hypothetical protein
MKVKLNKKQEVVITLSDSEASNLTDLLNEAYCKYQDALSDKKFMKVLNEPDYCELKTKFYNKLNMSDWLYNLILYAQGFYVDREGFDE